MRWRAESEDVEQQAFVVTLPAVRDEPVLRPPAMREGRSAITGPVPVGPTVQRIGQVPDLDFVWRVAVEIGGRPSSAPANRNAESMVDSSHCQTRRPVSMSRKW